MQKELKNGKHSELVCAIFSDLAAQILKTFTIILVYWPQIKPYTVLEALGLFYTDYEIIKMF